MLFAVFKEIQDFSVFTVTFIPEMHPEVDLKALFQLVFHDLKLVLNADKTKVALFSNVKSEKQSPSSTCASQGTQIVPHYMYLGMFLICFGFFFYTSYSAVGEQVETETRFLF